MRTIELLLALVALISQLGQGRLRAFADPPAKKAATSAQPEPHLDCYGDPLPERAVCRLGTLRALHYASIINVAFSPDGRRFASTAHDGSVVVWSWESGKELHVFPPYTTLEHHGLQFSSDNRYLAGFDGKTVAIWHLNTGRSIHRGAAVRYPVFSPDSKRIAWLTDTRSIRVLALGAGKGPETVSRRHDVLAFGYDKDGHLRIVEHRKPMLSLRDLKTDRQLAAIDLGEDPPGWLELASDGSSLAVLTRKTGITLRDTGTGEQLGRLVKLPDNFTPATLSRDGEKILLKGGPDADAAFQIWDVIKGKKVCAIDKGMGYDGPRFGAFSPDGKLLAIAGMNVPDGVSFWDAETGERVDKSPGHNNLIADVAFSPNGAEVATCSVVLRDPVVRIWDAETGRLLRMFDAHPFGVNRVAYTPDGTRLITGGRGGENVRVWDARTLKQLRGMNVNWYGVGQLAVSADGERFVAVQTGTAPDKVIVWDLQTGKKLHEHRTLGQSTRGIAFLPGNQALLICNHTEIRTWDVAAALGSGERDLVRGVALSMALSPDGRVLALTGKVKDTTTRLVEVISGQEICRFGDDRKGDSIAFGPDGRTVALGTKEGTIRLFNWPTGRECLSFRASNRDVWCLTFSPDGKRLASVCRDPEWATALLWDVSDATGRPLQPVKAEGRQIEAWCEALAAPDAAAAYRAVWNLVAAPEASVAALKKRLTASTALPQADITRLIADLDSEDFAVREKAQGRLARAGAGIVGDLQAARKGSVSPEQKRRLQQILETLRAQPISSEDLFAVRAAMVLEQIGDGKARRLLRELAERDDKARRTQEARWSLKRLGRVPD